MRNKNLQSLQIKFALFNACSKLRSKSFASINYLKHR